MSIHLGFFYESMYHVGSTLGIRIVHNKIVLLMIISDHHLRTYLTSVLGFILVDQVHKEKSGKSTQIRTKTITNYFR